MAAATISPQQLIQPDIAYAPNLAKYQERTKRRLSSERIENSLPPGFPSQLVSQLVWEGNDLEGSYQWVYELNKAQVDEIESALNHFKC